MIGLELGERGAVAVSIDAAGRVVGRSTPAAASDLPAAALAVVGTLSPAPGEAVAVASLMPDSPEAAATLHALGERFALANGRAFASGAAAAAAEAWVGAAAGADDVVFFGVGDHPLAGVLRDGRPFNGAHRRAPVVAWLALNPVEREDYRRIGCLEAEVAAAGIVRRFVWRLKAGDSSSVLDVVNGEMAAITIDHLFDAARAADGVAVSVMRDTAKYLGMAAANLVLITDPQAIVLGGAIASAADLLFEPVRVELTRRLPPAMLETLTIVPAALGADAAAIGAVRLASVDRL